jgi:hypothetical protein
MPTSCLLLYSPLPSLLCSSNISRDITTTNTSLSISFVTSSFNLYLLQANPLAVVAIYIDCLLQSNRHPSRKLLSLSRALHFDIRTFYPLLTDHTDTPTDQLRDIDIP